MPEVPFEQDPNFLKLFDQTSETSEPSLDSNSGIPTFDPTNYLETGEPRTKEVDLSLGSPNQWVQPSAPNPITAPSSKGYNSEIDMIDDVMSILKKKSPNFTDDPSINPTLTPQSITRKYKDMSSGYIPGVDLDTFYGEKESSWKTFGKGLFRFPVSTGIKTGQGLGYIAGLLDPTNWGSDIISKAADNGFSKIFDGLDDKLKNEWVPTFQESYDKNKGFWARAFTDGDFWMDDAVDGLAFMASAWIPGLALSKLGLGLKTAQALSKLRIGVTAAEAAVEGAGEVANYLSKANSVFKTGVDKFNAWALATASESMFESVGVKNSVLQSLSVDPVTGKAPINPETGMPYTEKEKKQIAAAAAQNTFILNAALLSATNAIELSWFGKAFGSAEGGAAKGLIGAAGLGDAIGLAPSPTKFFDKFISSKKGAFIRGGLEGIAAEGFVEENGQLAIQRINEHYGTKGKIADAFNLGELFGQYFKQTGQAIIGQDPEAAANIGIGGLLGVFGGGIKGASDFSKQQAINQASMTAFNKANESWLKFGNLYKTEDIILKDESGNEIKTQRILRDAANNPILDAEKLAGITASYRSINGALNEAAKTQDKFKKDVLRDTAYADLVLAHINAGVEDTLMDKLDNIRKASPEDLAKLGFSLDKNVDEQINRYKSLTASIIEQNKLLNSDIIFDESIEDKNRKYKLTSLAAEQAVHKNLLSEINNDAQKIKNQMLTSENTSLTDGLVDQLNDIDSRIKSQKEVIREFKKMGLDESFLEFSQTIIDELEEDKANLLKNNEETVKTLKRKGGKFIYDKPQRNEPGFSEQYEKKIKLKGEVQNHIRQLGLEWAKYADTINGKSNFIKAAILDAIKSAEKQEEQSKKEIKTPEEKPFRIDFTNEQGEDDSISIVEGKTYEIENKDGKVDLVKIIKISDDGKIVTFSINDDGAIDADAQEFGKMAKASDMKEADIPTEKPKVISEKAEHPVELESDVAIEERVDLPTFSFTDKKPKFELVGFNKTFGRHYLDDNDQDINKKYGSDRFFAFTSKYDVSKGDYVLQVVTKNNDDFDIRQSDINPDDIKVIVLKKTVDKKGKITYNYVNENNEIIPDNEANKNNIVYRSLPDIKNWTPTSVRGTLVKGEYVGAAYTVDESTTDEMIQAQIDAHIKYQDELVKRTKKAPVFLQITGSSPGIQKIMYTNDGEIAKAPAEGRVIESDPDWSELRSISNPDNYIRLRVSTREGAIAPGILPGRVVFQEYYIDNSGNKVNTNNVTRVFNRELLPSEKENIIKALARFSELFGRDKKNPLLLPEQNEYSLILEYLKGMLNWSIPKEGQSVNKFMWIANGLHVGNKVYKFDRETIEKNKEDILKNTYHHVHNKMLWRGDSFTTIKFVNNKAVEDKSYKTYQEYLLAKRDNGEVPPVYTSLPLYDSETPQRTNVFLTWSDPANKEIVPIGPVERTYKKEYKETKKKRKKYSAVDRVIDSFINYKTKDITIYGVSIRHSKKGNKLYVKFYNPSTNKSFTTAGFTSVKNLIDNKYKLKNLIYKLSGYNPYTEVADTEEKVVKKGNKVVATKPSGKIKGEIVVATDEEKIVSGNIVSTIRSGSYHNKFYKGDGIYKSESGQFFEIEYKGLVKYKNGRIRGRDINMSKSQFAKEFGFKSWDAFEENATKWSPKDLVDGKAVHYYSISPIVEGQETIKEEGKPATKKAGKQFISLKDLGASSIQEAIEIIKSGNIPAKAGEKVTPREEQLIKQKGLIERTKDLTKWVDDIFKVLDEEKFNKFVNEYDQTVLEKELGPILKKLKTQEEIVNASLKYYLPKFIDAELSEIKKQAPKESATKKTGAFNIADALEKVKKSGNKGWVSLKDLQEAQEEEEEEQPPVEETKGGMSGLASLIQKAQQSGTQGWVSAKDLAEKQTGKEAKKGLESFKIGESVITPVIENGKVIGRLYEENQKTGEKVLFAESRVQIINNDLEKAITKLKQDLLSQIPTTDQESTFDEAPPFRLPLEQVERLEDFENLTKVMDDILPQFSIKKMAQLIQNKAWGSFYNGALYIFEKAGIGTGFHEAFEAVWAAYLTDAERLELANEFRSRKGTFYNPFTKQTKEYSKASMYDVREMIAEEFSKFMLDDKMDDKTGNKILNFFKELWNSIKALFNLNRKNKQQLNSSINKVFKTIKGGGYRNATPIRELNKIAPVYKAVGNLTQKETAGVLEGINYYFFTNLYSRGNNINTILGGLTKQESNAILSEIFENSYSTVINNLDAKALTTLKNEVETFKPEIYLRFKQNLERYGVMFSELEQDEEDTTDTLGIRDSITIDPRKMTDQNIRILLASLPEITYKNKTPILQRNEFNQPKLINADKAHQILLNELSNIAPIINKDGQRINVIDQMFDRLDSKFRNPKDGTYKKDYYWIKGLKSRLKYWSYDDASDFIGTKVDVSTLSKDELKLRIAFTKSFNNIKTQPAKTIVDSEGNVYNYNPLNNLNVDRVRLNWSNNLKLLVQNKQSDIVKVDGYGRMVIDRSSSEYSLLEKKLIGPMTLNKALDVLGVLGIKFSLDDEALLKYEENIKENAVQILSLVKKGDLNTISEIYGNQVIDGRIKDLLAIEAEYSSEDNVLSYLNAKGEPQYSVGIPSLLSNMINILNTVKDHTELINTCPWLGYFDSKGKPVLNPYQENSELIKKDGILFNQNGKRRAIIDNQVAKINYHVISGMGLTDDFGTTTSDLKFPERVANKIHYLLKNIVFSNINSDKSTEFGIGIPGKPLVSAQDVRNFLALTSGEVEDEAAAPLYSTVNKAITTRYVNHLIDEMASALLQKESPQYIQYYQEGVFNLGHFKDILGSELIAKFKKEVLSDKAIYKGSDAHLRFLKAERVKIESKITSYLNDKILETSNFLKDLDIFEPSPKKGDDRYISDSVDNQALVDLLKIKADTEENPSADNQVVKVNDSIRVVFTEDNLNTIAGFLAINEELLLTEQHKLIYGHPAIYKDLAKRVSGATATKESLVEDDDVIKWMDANMVRNDGKERSNDVHQTTKVISFKDQNVVSLFYKDIVEGMYMDFIESGMAKKDAQTKVGAKFNDNNELEEYIYDKEGNHTGAIKAYLNLNEADAMAWGMPDAIRDMLFQTSKFTPEQEAQWNYEIAYEKVARSKMFEKDKNGKKVYLPGYKSYDKEELKKAQEILDKGDPGYIFQVLKPQYFGYATTSEVTHPVFLKHAVQPKFFRHVEGTQYEKLYLAAQANQVDIIGFESGHKVGNVTNEDGEFTSIYNDKGEVNITESKKGYGLPTSLPIIDVYTKFYGIQVETSSKSKNSVVRGTQITKLIMVNFFNNGKPINAELGDLIKDYNDTLKQMISFGKTELLKELGLVKVNDQEYETENLSKLVSILRNEARNRDLPDNMIDAINAISPIDDEEGNQELEYKFDTLINREKIDNILNSIVDSRVISAKMNGRSSVQVASTLYESNPRGFMYLKNGVYKQLTAKEVKTLTAKEKESVRMTSSDLKFYYNQAGKVSKMECYVSWPFKEVTPEEVGLRLENGVYKISDKGLPNFDKELLNIIGFRIPTQAPNSIENIIIKGFTPAANGDMIVVPSEIVGKAGSDFDIDKLNLYFSNHYVDGPKYGSKEFKEFMVNDLVNNGLTPNAAEAMINGPYAYSTEDLIKINKATYSTKNKYEKNAPYSVEELMPDVDDYTMASKVKKSLTNYNAQFKGAKAIRYTKPGTDTKEALQNKYIDIMSKLISRPENYAQLVAPNSVATLKGLATDIKEAKVKAGTKSVENEKSYTYLRSFIGASQIRERYLTAKRMVGIAALHSTFHSLAQVSGLKINPTYNASGIYYLMPPGQKQKAITIKLDHYAPNEDGLYEIGHRTDVVGQMISDLFSEAVSGFVDGAKDPFVFDLNFSMNSAGTWFYLQHLGVPTEQIAYFFNQPILDEYFNELAKNNSNFKDINGKKVNRQELFLKVIAPYYNRIFKEDVLQEIDDAYERYFWSGKNKEKEVLNNISEISDSFEKFDIANLKKNIDKGSSADPKMQIAILMNFLEYEIQARQLSNFMQAISYDNKKTRTTQENMLQVARWERSKTEKFINNPEAILENTFIGEMKEQKEDVFNMFRNFFITLSPDVQKVFLPLYDKLNNPEYITRKDDMVNLLNRYQNFVITYLLHTTTYNNSEGMEETLNDLYDELFRGNNSLAKTLNDYKESSDRNISDNLIIKELIPMLTDDTSKTDNISLFRNKMDTFEINSVIESIDNLKEYALKTADDELLKFVNNLAKFAILQSGMQSSFIDYKKVLSVNIYSDLVKTILDQFSKNPELDSDSVWRSFHQNNWENRSIVPKAPSWMKYQNNELAVSVSSRYTINDYMIKYIRRGGISKAELKKMKKENRMYEAFEPVLFENTGLIQRRGKGYVLIYKPISKMGNGRKMTEIYKDDRDSIFEKNMLSKKSTKGSVPVNTSISMADIMADILKALQESEEVKLTEVQPTETAKETIELKDGNLYTGDQLNTLMLLNMGYSLPQAGELIKKYKC